MARNLTEKQQQFCLYYLESFNATKSYQKAYDCSYNIAMVEGHRNLRKPNIIQEIDKLKRHKSNSKFLSREDILQEYIDIAFSDEDKNKMKALDFLSKYYGLLNNKEKEELDIEKKKLENEKLKAEISKITGGHNDDESEGDGFIDALNGTAQEDWTVKLINKIK